MYSKNIDLMKLCVRIA